ncbi:CcdB family protein [Pusillimonas sp.]|uniref:CcdB family protein n=1 Tax=Pusillimonas sp. TaxID=3040095 RepID=UPI0037C8CC4F
MTALTHSLKSTVCHWRSTGCFDGPLQRLPQSVRLRISPQCPGRHHAAVQHAMVTQYMAAVPAKELKSATFSLQHRHDEIVAAIDLLFHTRLERVGQDPK